MTKLKSKVIVRKAGEEFDQVDDSNSRKLAIAERRSGLFSVEEKVAGDKFCYLNWYWPGGVEEFPMDPEMRMVRKYYPHAEGGPLLVDDPKWEIDVKKCIEKAHVLRRRGLRYLYVTEHMTEAEARTQLGEI